MLRALDLKDLVIVERVALELEGGFTVLTGETGAGKSILVDAIELLVGGRGDASVVRDGAERADLSAEFDFDSQGNLKSWIAEHDLAGDAGKLILRRSIDRSGRSRCFINGHAVTLAQLREAGEHLVDIHGQHAHQSLLRAAAQRELLDAHAGARPLSAETAAAFRDWKRLEKLALESVSQFRQRETERAELQERFDELKKLAPRDGEWQQVAADHSRLQHGSSLLAGAQSSLEALAEAEGACLPQLNAIAKQLRSLCEHDRKLEAVVDLLESAEAQAGEAARELRTYASRVELDPEQLREVEARIEALHAMARKHRVKPEELPAHFAGITQRLSELALAVDPEALQREVQGARERYAALARKLTSKRKSGAAALSKGVTLAMQQLAMAGGRFSIALKALDEPGAAGAEEIEFEVASHPSLPLRPLAKVASGGELSRVSLAIQVVAAKQSPVGTLVFDEIDSGIGGAVAETIGKALRVLGKERQVLCVTHLPQVAANGKEQWSVIRTGISVSVARLDRPARIRELARMLGGSEVTARKHAAELLDS